MKSVGLKLTIIMLAVILLGITITLCVAVTISSNVITRESLAQVNQNTQLEAERLDKWLSEQTIVIKTIANELSSMDSMADILVADRTNAEITLEDQVVGDLRPFFKSVLDDNDAYFEVYMGFLDGSAVAGSGYQFDYSWWKSFERGWYKLALTDTSKTHITSPYVDAQTGDMCITADRAVINRGQLIGVVAADIFVTDLEDIILKANLNSTGYAMLIDTNGDILVHPNQDYAPDANGEFRNISTVNNGFYADLWNKISAAVDVYKYPDTNGADQYYNVSTLSTTGWYVVTVLPVKIVTQPIRNVILIIIPITVAILLLAALMIYLTIRNIITQPLAPLTHFMRTAASTGVIVPTNEYMELAEQHMQKGENKDEISDLIVVAAAFVQRITEVSNAMDAVADGDLTSELSLLSEDDTMGHAVQKMLNNLNIMFGKINDFTRQVSTSSQQVADTAESIASGATQMANGAQALADGTTKQAASVEEVSNSIAEIAEKTKTNADTADQAAKLANSIISKAKKGSQQMDEMTTAVNDINEASKSVSNIMETINGIAVQTNLLSLNAAIEAARAGEHGKGFAVVAEEVRKLAAQSEEAVKETSSIIQNSMQKAELGARVAGEMAASLTEIVAGINESNRLIMEIAKASEEQSAGIEQVNANVNAVADVIKNNSAVAEESAAAAQESAAAAQESAAVADEMNSQTDVLKELTSQFKLYVPKRSSH